MGIVVYLYGRVNIISISSCSLLCVSRFHISSQRYRPRQILKLPEQLGTSCNKCANCIRRLQTIHPIYKQFGKEICCTCPIISPNMCSRPRGSDCPATRMRFLSSKISRWTCEFGEVTCRRVENDVSERWKYFQLRMGKCEKKRGSEALGNMSLFSWLIK